MKRATIRAEWLWPRLAMAVAGLAIAFAIDVPVMCLTEKRASTFERLDVVQFFRTGGYLPLWLAVAASILLEDRRRVGVWSGRAASRAAFLATSVTVAGVVAELGKLAFRRERATSLHVWYQFRPVWEATLRSGGLSMPSSHALIAFAGAIAAGRLFPAARPVLIAYAIGTATIRVMAGAHYVSDVYVSMLLACLVVPGVAQLLRGLRPEVDRSIFSGVHGGPIGRVDEPFREHAVLPPTSASAV